MKLNQKELELKILKGLVTLESGFDMATERGLDERHFMSKSPGSTKAITGKFYKLALQYYRESGGYLLTETVLESKLSQKGLKPQTQTKFMDLWNEVTQEECEKNDFPHLLLLLKDRYCIKLQSDTVEKLADYVKNDQVDECILALTDCVSKMYEEKEEFQNDKVNFDMSEADTFFFKEYDERALNPEQYKGLDSGLAQLDEKTLGFAPSQVIVFLAPSSGGKSVQLLNIADHAHRFVNKNVMYFSFEMSAWLCKLRHASLISEVDYHKLKGTCLTPAERIRVENAFSKIKNGKYFEYIEAIDDPTPEFIESKIKEITLEKAKPDLIVVDYIGNMHSRFSSKTAKYWEKNGDAFVGLHRLAKKYNLPILTAQQFNADSIKENRKKKEQGKAAAFYQDAAAGDKRLVHYATYIIGMDPDKENNTCWYHPVKMRDTWFQPFATKWIPEYNKIECLNESQQASLSSLKSSELGSEYAKEYAKLAHEMEDVEVSLSGWGDDF
jgi:replicative DNA helicase